MSSTRRYSETSGWSSLSFAHLLAEFDAPSGPVHDEVVADQGAWLGLLTGVIETARARGELAPGTDAGQLAFELYAPLELSSYLSTLHRDPTIIGRGRYAIRATLAAAAGGGGGLATAE